VSPPPRASLPFATHPLTRATRAALKTHPDRAAADSPDRTDRTRKFQLVNDAYYTLSDVSRRRDYDAQRRLFGQSASAGGPDPSMPGSFEGDPFAEAEAGASAGTGGAQNAYSWAWNFFSGGENRQQQRAQTEQAQFGDVFEEMMHEEGVDEPAQARTRFWQMAGAVSGGTMGFIIANMPGALAGAAVGNRLGAVRDARGKSVYSVFQVSWDVNLSIGGGSGGAEGGDGHEHEARRPDRRPERRPDRR
jgi:hypothetical protein